MRIRVACCIGLCAMLLAFVTPQEGLAGGCRAEMVLFFLDCDCNGYPDALWSYCAWGDEDEWDCDFFLCNYCCPYECLSYAQEVYCWFVVQNHTEGGANTRGAVAQCSLNTNTVTSSRRQKKTKSTNRSGVMAGTSKRAGFD